MLRSLKPAFAILLLFASLPAPAAPKHTKKEIALLVTTLAFSGVGTYLDMRSSLDFTGRPGPYGNPIYESSGWYASGRDHGFHARGIAVMWSITAGVSAAEYLTWRRRSVAQAIPESLGSTLALKHYRAWAHNVTIMQRGEHWALTR